MDVVEAHKHSIYHRAQIESSEVCGCFFCLAIYPPTTIAEWTDDETTALCPKCGIDSVIGSASGAPITAEFLEQMKQHWF
jgi:hypothetical protein